MKNNLTKESLKAQKDTAIKKLDSYITSLIESESSLDSGKASKLNYWLNDWTTFLDFEPKFSPRSLRRYKRGEIIKVHLGFNVGSEEGGLHYAVVIDKNNSVNSPILTIVPLTSVKPTTNLDKLHKGNIYLGNELFTNLSSKLSSLIASLKTEINYLQERINSLESAESSDKFSEILAETGFKIDKAEQKLELVLRIKREIQKMKRGSIALTCQVRTISKIRIYDPKTNFDILSNIKLSNEKLDLIDQSIKELFIK